MKLWHKFINHIWAINEPVSLANASLSLLLTLMLLAVLAVLVLRNCQ